MMQTEMWDWQVEIDESLVSASPDEIRAQIAEYERSDRDEFDLEVEFPESFTGQVMAAMAEIPRGETRTYGDIAETLDTAAIAVGQACGRNPVPVVVPCHRIVAADGLGGYSGGKGDRLTLKKRLLDLESESESR
ncbi:methylated-DNA-[protein]-cysteine S-methyltransferase [Haladaptatus litoreus]|uniref:Methylated-DNA-[protein]-cysteine S-methyltransferase n=2 Tax=Haladaptatus litoreus TaxID=553468 RepID=A0A1N6XW48_9EURY|nr:methylated-DNA--[protein]-cysteine S-methyltransferase [Haladaptatus litoreus]SIR06635.1 methylated-DNA-[protein]-cysteine S-methyltransferase [Haladaptatus litoreus]